MMVMAGVVLSQPCLSATKKASTSSKAKKQSAIQKGTSVRTRVEAKGIYDEECYDLYYGCMDQFCITDNSNGGSCACSDANAEYEKKLEAIQETLLEAERIRTVEVEKVKAGADADIVFTGERRYDDDGRVLKIGEKSQSEKKQEEMSKWMSNLYGDDEEEEDEEIDLADLKGSELFKAAEDICIEQMPEKCDKDMKFFHQLYTRQISSDCKGFENTLSEKEFAANMEVQKANGEVRNALKESLEEANKYDLGQCMVQFKKCMQTDDACGKEWENCVSTVANENMQNNAAENVAGTKVETDNKFELALSTMEVLNAKRPICEHVLKECVAVRDMVWPSFLREAAPVIKVAESKIESKVRQSCLSSISECIQKACKDDIVGKGVETMDACLARPDMARSFCKVEIDPCERMEPQIFEYVKDKLAAMRVDACTQEVKDCFFAEDRCGEDFKNCLGMDYNYIHDICPLDKLVVCKQANPKFAMSDLDSMLMGLYLNIDNKALDQCQELVDKKMAEICGSTTDCNKFAADDVIGTGSLRSQKVGATYRVTGMISFGSIKMGDAAGLVQDKKVSTNKKGKKKEEVIVLKPGEIGVEDYITEVRARNSDVENAEGIISSIEEELHNIAGTINRTIEMFEQDPEIQFCINGRDLSQITGEKGAKTTARFPQLLTQVKMQIAVAALRQAQDNYNKKFTEEVTAATQNASADVAQYVCQKIAETNNTAIGSVSVDDPLAPPFSISYDVGSGLDTSNLTTGGKGHFVVETANGGKTTTDVASTFDREGRQCHVCRTITSISCSRKGGNWFSRSSTTCTDPKVVGPTCEDIKM